MKPKRYETIRLFIIGNYNLLGEEDIVRLFIVQAHK